MNTKKIKQHGSIRVQVPSSSTIDGGLFQQGAYLLMLQSLDYKHQFLTKDDDGNEYNVALINTIQPEFITAILNKDITEGYRIAMMNNGSNQGVYAHVPSIKLDEVPNFTKTEENPTGVTLREFVSINRKTVDSVIIEDGENTYVLIEAYQYNYGRLGFTTFEEIMEFAVEYGNESIKIINRLSNEEL